MSAYIYQISEKDFWYLQYFDNFETYLTNDVALSSYFFEAVVAYLSRNWKHPGRPIMTVLISDAHIDGMFLLPC